MEYVKSFASGAALSLVFFLTHWSAPIHLFREQGAFSLMALLWPWALGGFAYLVFCSRTQRLPLFPPQLDWKKAVVAGGCMGVGLLLTGLTPYTALSLSMLIDQAAILYSVSGLVGFFIAKKIAEHAFRS